MTIADIVRLNALGGQEAEEGRQHVSRIAIRNLLQERAVTGVHPGFASAAGCLSVEPDWMANLGPSEALMSAMRNDRISWAEFSRRYRKELKEGGSIDKRNPNIKNHGQKFTLRLLQKLGRQQNVTLMCHCAEDQEECHRHLLKKVLESKIS